MSEHRPAASVREHDGAVNPECWFIKRGDFNDCAHAGGGRGAKDEWCDSCKAVYGPGVPEVRADEPFGTVVGGIPLPESMKGVPLIDAKDVPPPTFERDAATSGGPIPTPDAAVAHLRALAALRQATWEATQFITDEAILSLVQGVLREVESDAP